jgi:hypothetical protein
MKIHAGSLPRGLTDLPTNDQTGACTKKEGDLTPPYQPPRRPPAAGSNNHRPEGWRTRGQALDPFDRRHRPDLAAVALQQQADPLQPIINASASKSGRRQPLIVPPKPQVLTKGAGDRGRPLAHTGRTSRTRHRTLNAEPATQPSCLCKRPTLLAVAVQIHRLPTRPHPNPQPNPPMLNARH